MENKRKIHTLVAIVMVGVLLLSMIPIAPAQASSKNQKQLDTMKRATQATGYTYLSAVSEVTQKHNVITIHYVNKEKSKITFLEPGLFRFNMEVDGKEESFKTYAEPNNKKETGRIIQQKDDSIEYSKPTALLRTQGETIFITTEEIQLEIDKQSSKMKLRNATGDLVWEERAPLQYKKGSTIQTFVEHKNENFYGGGTQNGRFAHKGTSIEIKNTNNWVDGGVASPNPFYWSTNGYGIVRNTFKPGVYDFGKTDPGVVTTTHEEHRFDAYYVVGEKPSDILDKYYKVTGNPMLFPENSFYLGHLNCYNRDEWTPATSGGHLLEDGHRYKETNNAGQILNGGLLESLNGTHPGGLDYKFSAQAVVNGHVNHDMPLGWFLPNDGYGCGYGQSKQSIDKNVSNLKQFSDYAKARGVNTGLWTQSALTPDPNEPIHLQRDFEKEVRNGGVRTLKTDVAWVGSGYSFALDGIRNAYDIIAKTKERPTIVSLDGWAGTQRYAGIWTGDQTGGNWEYIRFHIPTYIGQSLSGNPNVSSDVDGIFGGSSLIQTRDIQWKSFTTMMLDMDGWGSYPKKPYIFGEDTTSINRMYLKLRAELLPYIYSTAYTSSNLGSKEEKGKPQVRAMFIEYPEDPNTYGTNVQYQYMFGKNLLIAPIYKNTRAQENGDDIRNGIYLPDEQQIWIDYFTGKQYRGGRTLNAFDAPIWKLPLFVKKGAILPMYFENNNPDPISDTNKKGLDKTKRSIEFYPDASTKESEFILYEDDGNSIDHSNLEEPSYGSTVTTKFTSNVANGTARLIAEKSNGNYTGYDANRETTFVVNVSQEPTDMFANNGDVRLQKSDFKVVTTQTAFDQAVGNVYFYNETPNLNKHATQGSEFQKKNITTTPKLYVKFAKTNVSKNTIELVLHDFVNDGNLDKNELNNHLQALLNLSAQKQHITPTSIALTWNQVEGATAYELETDGSLQSGITSTSFQHIDLAYHSTHTYRVRAVNADGYSSWSAPIKVQTALDPYRNVPKDIQLQWEHGDSWGALQNALDFDYGTMFHSSNGDAVGKDLIMDMKKIYIMDKVEYTPRQDNKGNGTLQQLDIYASVDGKQYTLVHEGAKDEWTYTNDDSRDTKTVSLAGVKTRYLKFVVRKSKGGFFSAAELQPYKKDGTTGLVPGDTNNDGVVDTEDLKQIGYYVGLEKGDAAWDQVESSDWNGNGYYDAQDITYTTTLIDGGIKNVAGNPEGNVQFIADKHFVKKGENVRVNMFGVNMNNVYSIGFKFPYDNNRMSFELAQSALATLHMQSYVYDRVRIPTHEETAAKYTRNANLVFSNIADQAVVNGTYALGSMTFRAQQDMEITKDTFHGVEAIFVSNNRASVNARAEPIQPSLPSVEKKLTADNFTLKGEDETVLQPGMGVDKLIDGNIGKDAYRFEFLWGNSEAEVPARLPYDITFTFDKPRTISKLLLYIRQDGGTLHAAALKEFDIIGIKTDGTQEKIVSGSLSSAKTSFLETNKVAYAGIIVRAKTSQAGHVFKLNIDEIELYERSETNVTGIELSKDNPKEIHVGRIASFSAKVLPNTASNPLYDITSSDPSVVEILKNTTETGYVYALKGNRAGTAILTITSQGSKEDGTRAFIETQIDVASELYTKDLEYLVSMALENIKYAQLFTENSLKDVERAIEKAQILIVEKPSQNEIDNHLIELNKAIIALTYVGSLEDQLDSQDEIINQNLALVSASSQANESPATNAIDGDTSTFWHSNYHSGVALPQDITIDLGGNYALQQVNYLPRQDGSHNGDITRYRIEVSSDGTTFIPVVEGTLANDGKALLNMDDTKKVKFKQTNARYVKCIALQSLGDKKNTYASAAEFSFYGKHVGENIPATSITLDKTEISDMRPGDVQTIKATMLPENTSDHITWSSNNEQVVIVNARGTISAVGQGNATITVVANEHVKAEIKVSVHGANNDDLQALIDAAKAIKYTHIELQNALHEAIHNAESMLHGTVEDIMNAYRVLAARMKELAILNDNVSALISYTAVDLRLFEAGAHATAYEALVKQAIVFTNTPLIYSDEILEMRKTMQDAYQKLVKLNLDQLQATIDYAKRVQLDTYVNNDAKTNFIARIEEAETLKPTSNKQIKWMIDNLIESLKALEKQASSTQHTTIKELLNAMRALHLANYSQANQAKLVKGMEEAVAALANSNLGYKEAEHLIFRLHELLMLQPENKDPNTGDETITTNPSKPVVTGDDTVGLGWLYCLVFSGLGSLIVLRIKKN